MFRDFAARRSRVWIFAGLMAGMAVIGFGQAARAQEGFEIRVEQYEEPARGAFELEQHLTYIGDGTRTFDHGVAPTYHQLHFATELTAGITDHVSLGVMALGAVRPGIGGIHYAGWRLIPHVYLPDAWHLPVKLGLTAEISFPDANHDASSFSLELRPTIEKQIGRFQLDLNPAIARSLSSRDRWSLQPAFRVAYRATERFSPNVEYYSVLGAIPFPRLDDQIHQIYSGADMRLRSNIVWNCGVGVALTGAGNKLVYKTRLEISFGRKNGS